MIVIVRSRKAVEFACYSAACAPHNGGGSLPGIDSLFKGASQIVAPFPSAGRRKGESKLPPAEVINEALRNPKLTPVDPKTVKTQQGFVTREGVAYYLTPKYKQTGETFADPTDRGNRFPMVWKKPNGDMVLLSGNHRFTAALIEGRMQDAIVVET